MIFGWLFLEAFAMERGLLCKFCALKKIIFSIHDSEEMSEIFSKKLKKTNPLSKD